MSLTYILLSGVIYSGLSCNPCVHYEDRLLVERSQEYFATKSTIEVPFGLFGAGQSIACALVSFQVDERGRPHEIRVVRSVPSRMIEREAVRAAGQIRVDMTKDGRPNKFLVSFEVSEEDVK